MPPNEVAAPFQRRDSAETKTIDKAAVCWNLFSRSIASVAQLAEQLALNLNRLFTTIYFGIEEAKTLANPRFSLAFLTPTSPQKTSRGTKGIQSRKLTAYQSARSDLFRCATGIQSSQSLSGVILRSGYELFNPEERAGTAPPGPAAYVTGP